MHLAVAAEVALDLPGDPPSDPDLGGADRVAELPVDPVGVGARVEVGRALEVVLGLGRVADLAADPREPEHADRVALVRAPDDVELAALVEQLVGIDPPGAQVVALHRVVVEHDRLAPEDRGLDLGQPLGDLVAAGRAGDPERDRVLLGGAQRARAAPGDLLQRQPQRLGVGELAVEQLQRGAQRRQLLVGELDRGQVEVLGRQRVRLLLDEAVDRLLDREQDPQRLELRAVGIEPARERVLVHRAVALDVAADLRRGHGTALGHQIGDQRQLADQLFGVLGHQIKCSSGGLTPIRQGTSRDAICAELELSRRVALETNALPPLAAPQSENSSASRPNIIPSSQPPRRQYARRRIPSRVKPARSNSRWAAELSPRHSAWTRCIL